MNVWNDKTLEEFAATASTTMERKLCEWLLSQRGISRALEEKVKVLEESLMKKRADVSPPICGICSKSKIISTDDFTTRPRCASCGTVLEQVSSPEPLVEEAINGSLVRHNSKVVMVGDVVVETDAAYKTALGLDPNLKYPHPLGWTDDWATLEWLRDRTNYLDPRFQKPKKEKA